MFHLDPFLVATDICDSGNGLIVTQALDIIGKEKTSSRASPSYK